jgi:hypothetical protein
MTGLEDALVTLLLTALPNLVGAPPRPVTLTVTAVEFVVDPQAVEAAVSEPRPDDRLDQLPWNAANPTGPYTLTQSPYPVPRRVYLQSANERVPLRPDEVQWDAIDPRQFSLNLRPHREVSAVSGVQVLYGVTAVFTKLKATQTLTVQLAATDAAQLAPAEALVVAIIELNREALIAAAHPVYTSGDYSAATTIKTLHLTKGSRTANGQRLLTLVAEIELKATRSLRADEGAPIQRILSPGRLGSAQRPIDLTIGVEG